MLDIFLAPPRDDKAVARVAVRADGHVVALLTVATSAFEGWKESGSIRSLRKKMPAFVTRRAAVGEGSCLHTVRASVLHVCVCTSGSVRDLCRVAVIADGRLRLKISWLRRENVCQWVCSGRPLRVREGVQGGC